MKPLKYWGPVLLWMLLIYLVSGDQESFHNTSRILDPILRWFDPDITYSQLRQIKLVIRKGGHVFEYAVLAVLWWSALRHLNQTEPGKMGWWPAGQAFLLSVAYAITDEYHQSFVRTRVGTAWDVLIDSCGAALGIALAYLFWKLLRPRPKTLEVTKTGNSE